MRLKLIVAMVVTMVMVAGSALALDQSACEFDECIGRVELHELGAFDAAGNWQWNITEPDLIQAIADDAVMGDNNTINWQDGGALTPIKNGISIDWKVLRNRRGPSSGEYTSLANGPDASIMMEGTVDAISIPQIMKGENEWGIYFQIDHHWKAEALQACEETDWDQSPGSPCDIWHQDNNGDGIADYSNGFVMFNEGGAKLTEDNVASITWVNKSKTVGVRDNAFENYIFMKYDMGQNILEDRGLQSGRTLYFDSFGSDIGPAEVGDHEFMITLLDGRTDNFMIHAASNRLMPTVPSTITQTQLTAIKTLGKSGKVMAVEGEVTIANMTAREIVDEDGATRLLIQWAEPDMAMMFSEYLKDVRLRVWVGNHWLTPSPTNTAYFLWMDLPVTSGSVVVPPDAYAWVKEKVLANGETELQISGQYREQFDGFHNRGYMGMITFPIQ